MRVCIVGGIFDKDEYYRARHVFTPETVLVDGLRARGVDVVGKGHAEFASSDDFDIVHVHHMGRAAYQMAAGTGAARFVFTGHDPMLLCGYERSRVRRAAFRYVLRHCDGAVALSHAEANFLNLQAEGRVQLRVIANGIPPNVYRAPAVVEWQPQDPHELLFVGQLRAFKGVDTLLHAVLLVSRQWSVRVRLVYQNADLEAEYRALARRLGIEELVSFEGFLSPPELAKLYSRASILVHPTNADSLPSVLTEALLCGTPIVSSRVGGIPEQVGEYALLVQPANAPELARAIEESLRTVPALKARAADMRDYAKRKFNIGDMVAAHEAFYRALLDGPGREKVRVAPLRDAALRFAIRAYWPSVPRRSIAAPLNAGAAA